MKSIKHLKGLHPGIVLQRELEKRKIPKGPFAISIQEYPQTLSAITKGKRSMNTALALRIEKMLGMEEGFLMLLQVFYDIEEEKKKTTMVSMPDLKKIRPALFWDTDINKIDWVTQKRAIIERVWDRGSIAEQNEMTKFYGRDEVNKILSTLHQKI